MAVTPTFTERLATRRRLWWDPPWPGRERTFADAVHRLGERRALRSRDDPDAVWRCCRFWPRTLLNKWNAREFAAKHGAPLPELYWRGSDYSAAPLESLPDHFVIRPMLGDKRRTFVVVDGQERLWGRGASADEVQDGLSRSRFGRPATILIEEFAMPHAPDRYELPLECKFHTFAGSVEAIELLERQPARAGARYKARHRYYTVDWEPIADPINVHLPEDPELKDRPARLEEMLALVGRIGAATGTYLRIDFFLTPAGFVFNEFSSLPAGGGYNTPYCDRSFGQAWADRCPAAS